MFTTTKTRNSSICRAEVSHRPIFCKGGFTLLVGAAVVFALIQTPLWAQQAESTRRSGHNIAVIDIAHIFKNLPSIQAQVKKVEADVKKYEAEIKQQQEALKQAVEQLKTLRPGTSDYARQEERIAAMDSKLRLDMNRKQQELRDAESKIYFDNYQRIAAAVKVIAVHNKIHLVLRFNGEEMELEKTDSVARGVMKSIVFHDSTINMTDTVMKYLEQQGGGAHIATGGRRTSNNNR